MVGSAGIRDRDSLKAWLEGQPRDVAVWIASRAAARVLPLWWNAVLTEDWAREHDLTALPVLRSVLISSVTAVGPNSEICRASEAAETAITTANNIAQVSAAYTAGNATAAATAAGAVIAGNVDSIAAAAAYAAAAAAAAASTNAADTSTTTIQTIYPMAARAAAYADAGADNWRTVRSDAKRVAGGGIPDAVPLWPEGRGPLAETWAAIKRQAANSEGAGDWRFWVAWYDALLDGLPMLGDAERTREMLEKIALIDPRTWDKGPEAVNPVIREILEGYREDASGAATAAGPKPISQGAKEAMKQRVAVNRDALAVAVAGLLDQLGTFKEDVRGLNHLDPELREELLAFIDEFTGKLSALLEGLPRPGESVDDDHAGRLVLWLREYRGMLRDKLTYYGSAGNMAEATVPTAIILGATGVGAMLGMPVAGSVVGGLIVNQMKPAQAARELIKPSGKDNDAPWAVAGAGWGGSEPDRRRPGAQVVGRHPPAPRHALPSSPRTPLRPPEFRARV